MPSLPILFVLFLAWVQLPCTDMQVDIIDLLYRCAKHGSVPDTYLSAFSSKVTPNLCGEIAVQQLCQA